jgi:hypothetical protein
LRSISQACGQQQVTATFSISQEFSEQVETAIYTTSATRSSTVADGFHLAYFRIVQSASNASFSPIFFHSS